MQPISRPAAAILLFLSFTRAAAQAPCDTDWADRFGGSGVVQAIGIRCFEIFDDGTGPALHAGGTFVNPQSPFGHRTVARWNGRSWIRLTAHVPSQPMDAYALAVFDDGTGPALYAGGTFQSAGGVPVTGIARWNGVSWSALPGGGAGGVTPSVLSLAVHDDGGGARLYAGGFFTSLGGVPANGIARWNGVTWSALGSGIATFVGALASFDDGGGPALFAGGSFANAGGIPAANIARWRGGAWSALGGGLINGSGAVLTVTSLAVFDEGGGARLYAGGDFTTAGGAPAASVARWNGQSWSPVGAGLSGGFIGVRCLLVYDIGGLPALYAGGDFTSAGPNFARWTGSGWTGVGGGADGIVAALSGIDDGSGVALFAGGSFLNAGPVRADGVARWDGFQWSALGLGLDGVPASFLGADFGGGPALYAAGGFATAGGIAVNHIARFDGTRWSPLGSGLSGVLPNGTPTVPALALHDDGAGTQLYAGGYFTGAGGIPAANVARWSGTVWTPVGTGLLNPVSALLSWNGGGTNGLYAGGTFPGGIARWNGSAWSVVGGGVSGLVTDPSVDALAIFDGGGGPALFAAGFFSAAGAAQAVRLARWDGAAWSAVGGLITGGFITLITGLAVFDDGAGAELYICGSFTNAAGLPVANIVRWDGTTFQPAGTGLTGAGWPGRLAVHDDGSGAALYAAGGFTTAGGLAAPGLAKWRNGAWTPVAGATTDTYGNSPPGVLGTVASGAAAGLYAGGWFTAAGGRHSRSIARLVAAREPRLILSQVDGPGSGVRIVHTDLIPAHEYFTVFSLEPCPAGPGAGPYLGLCSSNLAALVQQLYQPVGALPFHFVSAAGIQASGPYPVPAGIVADGVCFDFTGGALRCVSPVTRFTVN